MGIHGKRGGDADYLAYRLGATAATNFLDTLRPGVDRQDGA